MTVALYARRKSWPLEAVTVRLRHSKIHKADCADGWLLAQNLVSVLRRTGSADSAEPSRSSCTERPGCSKAAKWSQFFSSLSPLRRAFGRRLLQRRTP